jgi:hypothetical protein
LVEQRIRNAKVGSSTLLTGTISLGRQSHHGAPSEGKADLLVFYEFGSDIMETCTGAGFEVELLRDSTNPALVTFLAQRPN